MNIQKLELILLLKLVSIIDGMINAVESILPMVGDRTQLIPGHGPLSNHAELMAYRDMLVTVRDRVSEAIDTGMSADELVASNPTADLDEIWGNGFLWPEAFLRIVYEDLSR